MTVGQVCPLSEHNPEGETVKIESYKLSARTVKVKSEIKSSFDVLKSMRKTYNKQFAVLEPMGKRQF